MEDDNPEMETEAFEERKRPSKLRPSYEEIQKKQALDPLQQRKAEMLKRQ